MPLVAALGLLLRRCFEHGNIVAPGQGLGSWVLGYDRVSNALTSTSLKRDITQMRALMPKAQHLRPATEHLRPKTRLLLHYGVFHARAAA